MSRAAKGFALLSALCAVAGAVQLFWQPSRFGGVFFLVLAIGCAGEAYTLDKRKRCPVCRVLSAVGAALFALFVASFAVIQIGVIGRGMEYDPEAAEADYVLVLGARVYEDGRPSAALAARCDVAGGFLAGHPDAQAILCGGQGANEPRTEAETMFDYMTGAGVDPSRLLLESESSNTIENIANAREMTGAGARTAVITSDYHLARARRLMLHAGLDPVGVPAPTPYPGQWVSVRCREYCSILGLMVTGRW